MFEQLGVLLFGDDWDAMFLSDCGVSKQMIDNGALNYESNFLTHLLIHEIPLKVAEGPMVVIKIFEQEIKFLPSDFAYVAKLFHKKLKIEAHFLKILFWVPKQVIIRQEIFSCGQHRSVLSVQAPHFIMLECVLPITKNSQLLVKLELFPLYRIANGHV